MAGRRGIAWHPQVCCRTAGPSRVAAFAICICSSHRFPGPCACSFLTKPDEAHAIRFPVPMPANTILLFSDYPVVSPDGRRMVIGGTTPEGKSLLWIHSLDSL